MSASILAKQPGLGIAMSSPQSWVEVMAATRDDEESARQALSKTEETQADLEDKATKLTASNEKLAERKTDLEKRARKQADVNAILKEIVAAQKNKILKNLRSADRLERSRQLLEKEKTDLLFNGAKFAGHIGTVAGVILLPVCPLAGLITGLISKIEIDFTGRAHESFCQDFYRERCVILPSDFAAFMNGRKTTWDQNSYFRTPCKFDRFL